MMIVLLNLVVLCGFWYINLDKFDTYQVDDEQFITYQQAKDHGIHVSPGNKYFKRTSKIIEKSKTNIPFVYNKVVLKEDSGYYSRKIE